MAPVTDLCVDTDLCYRCGYLLHGIANEQPCPECGLLAERSRRVSDELHNTRPRWLKRLSRGTKLLLLALLAPFFTPTLVGALQQWGGWLSLSATLEYRLALLLPFACLDIAALLLIGGVLLLTGREGYPAADRCVPRCPPCGAG